MTYERIEDVRRLKYGFVTGAAGRGKTSLIQEIIRQDHHWGYLVATTGVAARNLGNTSVTLHALLQCASIKDFRVAYESKKMHSALARVKGRHERLIVDECSMLLCEMFSLVYRACKEIDLGLILVGDFAQLPPVVKEEDIKDTPKPWLVFQSIYWQDFTNGTDMTNGRNIIKLLTNRRTSDGDFIKLLDALRAGNGALAEVLLSAAEVRWTRTANTIDERFPGLTLTGTGRTRDLINKVRYGTCHGPEIVYRKTSFGPQRVDWLDIPNEVRLKLGSQVMITRNEYNGERLYYANGSLGTVTGLHDKWVHVTLDDGTFVTVKEYSEDNSEWYPVVDQFGNITHAKTRATSGVNYMPLCLAWCSTVHKAQGLTKEKVQVYIDDLQHRGRARDSLLYVAASRCRRGSDLVLAGGSKLSDVCSIDPDVKVWV